MILNYNYKEYYHKLQSISIKVELLLMECQVNYKIKI